MEAKISDNFDFSEMNRIITCPINTLYNLPKEYGM